MNLPARLMQLFTSYLPAPLGRKDALAKAGATRAGKQPAGRAGRVGSATESIGERENRGEASQSRRSQDRSGTPLQAPPLPHPYIERPAARQAVMAQLLGKAHPPGTPVVSAIYGLDGIGKSTFAAALAHHPDIQTRFPDGILWTTLGPQPDVLSCLSAWLQALGDLDYTPTTVSAASARLRVLLCNRKTLLVVDDAWHADHVEPFRIGGQGCCLLVTARDATIPHAARFDLDVLSPEQALALLLEKSRRADADAISSEESQAARTLAETVGYLPLALELAEAQIADGFLTWQELLTELQAELAALQAPSPDPGKDEKHRKTLSLEASFNLSLRRLSPEQLQHFAWLGVLPKDTTITPEMAQTLWQLKPLQAGRRLQEFWQRALLVSEAKPAGKATYRLHNLTHDRAQQLVIAPEIPKAPDGLPGLGLSAPEAHGRLVARYRAQTDGGQWHTLPGDGYIHERLSWHLERAERPEELHRLLQEVTATGRNGWYEACSRLGQPVSFISTVARAWQLAETTYKAMPSQSITLQVRYALVTTSLHSLASNIPAELLGVLVEKGHWTPAQGVAYALQIQDIARRADAFVALAPYLPEELLPEFLSAIRQMQPGAPRARVLSHLARRQPSLLPEALAATRQIQSGAARARVLGRLAQRQPNLFQEALAAARQIQDKYYRAYTLSRLAQRQPNLFQEALAAARQIQDESSRAYALRSLAEYLPDSLLSVALEAACQIQSESSRAYALRSLVEYLPEALLPTALAAARQIQDESSRAYALRSLAAHLPASLLPTALEAACQIQSESSRAYALRSLAEYLPDSLLPDALAAARQIQDESSRADALSSLARRQPDLFQEALAAARQIQDESSRVHALSHLAQRQSDLFQEALAAARQIQDESSRAYTLSGLTESLPASLLPAALAAARQIQSESYRAYALWSLAERLPEPLLPEALAIARQIQSEYYRAYALSSLAQRQPDLFQEALEATRQIQSEYYRADALSSLAQRQPNLFQEALAAICQIQSESSRVDALSSLARQPNLFQEALAAICQIQSESSRVDALRSLADRLPESLLPAALDVACQIQSDSSRADALSGLAEYLPESLLPTALEAARQIQSEYYRADALSSLADCLPESLLSAALEAARQIQDESYRADALSSLADRLPESLLSAALEAARQIQDESYRAYALSSLVRHQPDLFQEALDVACQIQSESARADALSGLADRLPEYLLPAALAAVCQIQSESARADALSGLTLRLLRKDNSLALWKKLLRGLAHRNRQKFIADIDRLSEAIETLGGKGTILLVAQALKEVSQQWP